MQIYQSINISNEDHDDNDTKPACQSKSCLCRNLVDEETSFVMNSNSFLLKECKRKSKEGFNHVAIAELSHAIKHRTCLTTYIICLTLLFGFTIGFSLGSLRSRTKYIDENRNNHDKWKETEDKVFEFIDNSIYHDSQALLSESSSPMFRFSFQGSSAQPRPNVYLNRPEAYSLLIDSISGSSMSSMSEYSNDFFLLSSGLDVQSNQAYCGVASVVAVLNSLRFLKSTISDNGVDIPTDNLYSPHPYATQNDIFNQCTKTNVISHTGGGPGVDGILTPPYGLSMPQVAGLLRCHLNVTTGSGVGWEVQEQYVDKSHMTIGKMRFDIKNALTDPNSRVLVNYDRGAIGQDGGGHWSPVGSYSEKQDAFLILDVAKYRYPPAWVPTERLFDGLATYDDCGSWNFPDGQETLNEEERTTHTKDGYTTILEKLECTKTLRGYITVTRT